MMMSILRTTSLLRIATVLCHAARVCAAVAVCSVASGERPNVLFILADDVGVEPIGCYGGTSFATPHIDRLAAGGMRFLHCYSMPVCHPTRICLLTGRYPRKLENPRWGSFPKTLESQTIAAQLKRAGYATAVAGKWQLALLGEDPHQPQRMGFDESCLFGWHEGPRYHDPYLWENGSRRTATTGQYGPEIYVDFLVDFMKRHRDQPFFAFYSMALCHDVTDDLEQPVAYPPGLNRYMNYGEMVRSMDTCVGRILNAVSDLGLSEKTLIVFTGDNGTARRSIIRAVRDGEQQEKWTYLRENVVCEIDGRTVAGGKGSLKDSGTHVPLLVSWKGKIAPGQTVDDLVDFSDFLPTFSELAGESLTPDQQVDGISLAPRLIGSGSHARKWAYSESKQQFWVRTQRYKLTSTGQFFDLTTDPDEAHPLPTTARSPAESDAHGRLQEAIGQLEGR